MINFYINLTYYFMKQLIVKVINKKSEKALFERYVHCDPSSYPYAKTIDVFAVIFFNIPHDVIFEIQDIENTSL